MDAYASFERDVMAALRGAMKSLGHDVELPPLETPPDAAMGHAGMPCFPLARALRQGPPAIAAAVAEAVTLPEGSWIREVRAIGPYVNFFLDEARLASAVLADVDAALTADAKPGKVLLEHTSANPNGPLHVGRARNPILGDTLGRILRAAGHDVEVQYYMDDLGRQVALLYWGHANLDEADLPPLPEGREKDDHRLVRFYQAANERMQDDPEVAATVKELVARLETADPELLGPVTEVYQQCFAGMKASLDRLGVHYDSIVEESRFVADGTVERTIERLQSTDRAGREDDGANFLDMSAELEGNKSTKFFFTRKDGTSVYATRDVAYHAWKATQVGDAGRMVDVLGEDHRLQSLQVGIALEALGHRRPEVVFYAFVSLPEGKMSTRANRVVFLDDLLDEAHDRALAAVRERRGDDLDDAALERIAEAVGIAAIRFNIARVQPEKPIKFRWEDALDFEGDSAPYLMYAHARAASLTRKAEAEGVQPAVDEAHVGAGEAKLLAKVARWVSTVEDAADRAAPHRVCAFALELAGAFNEYYRDHQVVGADPAVASTRLAVMVAAKQALAKAHDALGLPVLEEM